MCLESDNQTFKTLVAFFTTFIYQIFISDKIRLKSDTKITTSGTGSYFVGSNLLIYYYD